MKVKPLDDRVLVKSETVAEKTSGGIYIPETAQEKTQNAVVVAVGDSNKIKVKVKDKIIHDKYGGTTISVEGEEHILLKSEDILAVIRK